MFGKSRPVLFEPYGRRRARGLPRWLVLLLVGIAVGAAGVLYIQQRYLPPRLTADASARLRESFEQADTERQQLKTELADTSQRLQAALAEQQRLGAELSQRSEAVARLQADAGSLVAALPPDPRNSPVAVRAARFAVDGGALAYDVVLTGGKPGAPLGGVLQFVVAGAAARGPETAVTLKPIPVSVGSYASVRGSLPLPDGFKPRQATIQVLDKVGGKQLGMRVMNLK